MLPILTPIDSAQDRQVAAQRLAIKALAAACLTAGLVAEATENQHVAALCRENVKTLAGVLDALRGMGWSA